MNDLQVRLWPWLACAALVAVPAQLYGQAEEAERLRIEVEGPSGNSGPIGDRRRSTAGGSEERPREFELDRRDMDRRDSDRGDANRRDVDRRDGAPGEYPIEILRRREQPERSRAETSGGQRGPADRPPTSRGPVYDGLPRDADGRPRDIDRRGPGPMERAERWQSLAEIRRATRMGPPWARELESFDRLLDSSAVRKVLQLMEENLELRMQLKVQQVEMEARQRLADLEVGHLKRDAERMMEQARDLQRQAEQKMREVEAMRESIEREQQERQAHERHSQRQEEHQTERYRRELAER